MLKRFHVIKGWKLKRGRDAVIYEMMKKYPHAQPPALGSSTKAGPNDGNFLSITFCAERVMQSVRGT